MPVVLGAVPALAATALEGRIGTEARKTASYDLLLEVWQEQDTLGAAKLRQTIQIPKVEVVKGAFTIRMDESALPKAGSRLSYKIRVRPFESWVAFRPAEVVRVFTLPVVGPGLVVR
ncbi:MAG: hypothetical protein ABI036_07270 [Fibrobacteria bacterium]